MASKKEAIRAWFVGREELSHEGMARHFEVSDDQLPEVLNALRLFEEEYGVRAGSLRRDDSLEIFFAGVGTSLIEAINNLELSDSLSELNYRLGTRRRLLRLPMEPTPETIGDFVGAWMGTDRGDLVE